jgi:hypothetical protein
MFPSVSMKSPFLGLFSKISLKHILISENKPICASILKTKAFYRRMGKNISVLGILRPGGVPAAPHGDTNSSGSMGGEGGAAVPLGEGALRLIPPHRILLKSNDFAIITRL